MKPPIAARAPAPSVALAAPILAAILLAGSCVAARPPIDEPAPQPVVLDLAIVGTRLVPDALGLPSRLEGLVFFRSGARAGALAGTYSETIRPGFDLRYGLVGARGRATFRFIARRDGRIAADTLVTENHSAILGELPDTGAIIVESNGAVVAGEGIHRGARGTLRSASTAILDGEFALDVDVSITLEPAAAGAGDAAAALAPPATPTELERRVRADGRLELRFPPSFKARLLARMLGPEAATPEALESQTEIPAAAFRRWLAEAEKMRALAAKMLAGEAAPRRRSFEEMLGVVIETASFSTPDLDAYLEKREISRDDLDSWRAAFRAALEASREDGALPSEGGAGDETQTTSRRHLEALRALRREVEGILDESTEPRAP